MWGAGSLPRETPTKERGGGAGYSPTTQGFLRGGGEEVRGAGAGVAQRRNSVGRGRPRPPSAQEHSRSGTEEKKGGKKETTAVVHTYLPPPLPCGGVGAAAWQLRSECPPSPRTRHARLAPLAPPASPPASRPSPPPAPSAWSHWVVHPNTNRYTPCTCTATPPQDAPIPTHHGGLPASSVPPQRGRPASDQLRRRPPQIRSAPLAN